ncbi:MAG: hypothetical protein VX341_12655 [Bdellovibrionota bacterium]|nr:hypothetical protein [Bdellovibrionota bacterium]
MKLVFLLIMTFLSTQAATMELVPVENVYTPRGFDSNDNAEIVITGYLPNLCYQNPTHKIIIDKQKIFIEMRATRINEVACPEVIVPYLKVIDLGVLDRGNYKIEVTAASQHSLNDQITIAKRTRGRIDEFNYPIVTNLDYDMTANELSIKAYRPSDCFEFRGFEFISDKKEVITVLPKMKRVRDFCPKKLTPLNLKTRIPNIVNGLRTLIHVRSLNLESKNIEVSL